MKKIWIMLSLAVLMLISCSVAFASDTTVYCDGEKVEFAEGPYIIDGSTFVPVRGLGEALDFKYTWDAQNRTVIVTSDVAIAWIQADNSAISVNKNGIMYAMTTESYPRIINDRIFIPLRAVSELFDADVEWDSNTSSVHIIKTVVVEQIEEPDNAGEEPVKTESFSGVGGISISDFTPPQKVTKGSPYVLSGTISSLASLDRVNIKIIDVSSEVVEINETQFDLSDKSYSLSDIDNRIAFGKLSVGDKIMQITCVDANENRQSFEYEFAVHQPQGAKIEGDVDMIWPVPSSGLITTIFWCDNPNCHSNAGRVNGHAALDIAADHGEDVVAVMDGVVKLQGFGNYENQKTGYGYFVLIDHGNGLETQYAHLSDIYVTDEQRVMAGDVIGAIGSTGNSTGPHLDFYITQDGVRCDPLYYLDFHENVRCKQSCDLPYFDAALEARGLK
ncbi:MAG: peptidoglycan DD-metalloendopeptidase family protein [Clostridia bacterium]|nr:peptidoglycan DD-metalloendopeptidase family protein [Clostridia bacterium]